MQHLLDLSILFGGLAAIAWASLHLDRLATFVLDWLDEFCRRLTGLPVGDSTAPGALSPPRADDSGLRPEIPHRVLD